VILHIVPCQVIRAALQAGRVDPSTVSALEMHGTGTSLGDPIEVGAAFAVLQPSNEPSFAAGALPRCMKCMCQTCVSLVVLQ
jgi:Beta-ketoacyl synthase, C-terminal domain